MYSENLNTMSGVGRCFPSRSELLYSADRVSAYTGGIPVASCTTVTRLGKGSPTTPAPRTQACSLLVQALGAAYGPGVKLAERLPTSGVTWDRPPAAPPRRDHGVTMDRRVLQVGRGKACIIT